MQEGSWGLFFFSVGWCRLGSWLCCFHVEIIGSESQSAHHCPLSQTNLRDRVSRRRKKEERKGMKKQGGKKMRREWGKMTRQREREWQRWEERELKERWRRRKKQEGGTKSWAVCQGLFHLCSPGLSELPRSLTSVMSSMKRPLGGMEDLTLGSECARHQLTLPSQAGFCSN